jgi:hypothetical protein
VTKSECRQRLREVLELVEKLAQQVGTENDKAFVVALIAARAEARELAAKYVAAVSEELQ